MVRGVSLLVVLCLAGCHSAPRREIHIAPANSGGTVELRLTMSAAPDNRPSSERLERLTKTTAKFAVDLGKAVLVAWLEAEMNKRGTPHDVNDIVERALLESVVQTLGSSRETSQR